MEMSPAVKSILNTRRPAVRSIDPEKDSIVFFSNLKPVDHYVAKLVAPVGSHITRILLVD